LVGPKTKDPAGKEDSADGVTVVPGARFMADEIEHVANSAATAQTAVMNCFIGVPFRFEQQMMILPYGQVLAAVGWCR
jgi:hypothetical protein